MKKYVGNIMIFGELFPVYLFAGGHDCGYYVKINNSFTKILCNPDDIQKED